MSSEGSNGSVINKATHKNLNSSADAAVDKYIYKYTLRNEVLELCSCFSGFVFNMYVLNKCDRLLYEQEMGVSCLIWVGVI